MALALCLLSPPLPVWAADDDEAALAKAETILFGEPSRDGDIDDRLDRAEKRVFGRHKSGSDEERIERLASTLLIDRKQLPATKKPEAQGQPAPVPAAAAEPEPAAQVKPEPSAPVPPEVSPKPESALETKTAEPGSLQPEVPKAKVATEKPAQTGGKLAVQKLDQSTLKGKGRKGARGARNTAAQPAIKGAPGAIKKPEITLTPETASMDEPRTEKPHPSVSSAPVTNSSASANRISRSAPPKVNQVTALLREGMEAHRKGEDVRAEQLFKRVVLLEPRNPDGYFNLGAMAEKKHDLAAALMSYHAALNLSPDDKELREAVDSVEGMINAQRSGRHVAANRNAKTKEPTVKTAESRNQTYRNDESRIDDYKSVASSDSNRAEAKTLEERKAEIRDFYGRESARRGNEAMENSDRFAGGDGSYGYGQTSQNGPVQAPNFYRAKAKTTRELQEEANPMADVNDPDAPEMSVSQPEPPVMNTSQPTPFQLQSVQSQAMTQATHRGHPVASVATRAFFGAALSVGASYALRSSGLHCPICRLGGGRALRGFMRF